MQQQKCETQMKTYLLSSSGGSAWSAASFRLKLTDTSWGGGGGSGGGGAVLKRGTLRRDDSGATDVVHLKTHTLSQNQLNVTSHMMNESLCWPCRVLCSHLAAVRHSRTVAD